MARGLKHTWNNTGTGVFLTIYLNNYETILFFGFANNDACRISFLQKR